MRIATLLTSHNRRSKTIASLEGVFSQKLPDGCTMEVFLVDDGSDDGTGEAVRHRFPRVHLLEGTGELFWSGGMRMAFTEALKGDYDFYWWVNDDTQLSSDALDRMVQTYFTLTERSERPPVIVGSVCDPQSGELTYGGVVRTTRWRPMKFELVFAADRARPCDTFNGNCVLIPREVARRVGNLDSGFTHRMGDTDYGLRAWRTGCSCWVAPGFVGQCARNPIAGTAMDMTLSFSERLKKLLEPKCLPPLQLMRLFRRHAGWAWGVCWLSPYVRFFLRECRLQARKIWD